MLRLFLLSFAVSLGVGYLTLRSEHLHARFTRDVAAKGSHKVHGASVTRIGGLCIFLGWTVGVIASASYGYISALTAAILAASLLPAFAGGFVEDLTKQVPPRMRLAASFLSAAIAYALLDASVSRVDVPGLDPLLALPAVAFVFTLVAVGGVAHAINIIDGLNGLASGVCLIALLSLGYVSHEVADRELVLLCGIGVGAIMGFRLWNYPSGRLFCGDGGAYFLGAYVAIVSALLISRHPQVSAWFPLLLVAYPVWETLFSAYRRRVLRGRPASAADRLHMHTLFYKRVKHPAQGGGRSRSRRNSDASVFMLLFAGGSAIPAVLWWSNTHLLLASAFAYILLYLGIYRRLVRFSKRNQSRRARFASSYVARGVAALHRAAVSRRTARESDKAR